MEHISAILANCWWMILLSALIAYLLGSINTAVLVTGIVTKGKKDIRQMGSGNAGFTNVLRSVGKVPAIITIVCDALKCIIAVLIGGFIFSFASVAFQGESPIFINELINCGKYVAGIFCILGHSYPVYFSPAQVRSSVHCWYRRHPWVRQSARLSECSGLPWHFPFRSVCSLSSRICCKVCLNPADG